jgi:hypothetical protein
MTVVLIGVTVACAWATWRFTTGRWNVSMPAATARLRIQAARKRADQKAFLAAQCKREDSRQ